MDNGMKTSIVSFMHCEPSNSILVNNIPQRCPLCQRSLAEYPLSTPPVRFPLFLTDSKSHPYSVIIKPTNGTFLGTYKKGDNLHTGVTDSKGNVFHFNEHGANLDVEPWTHCLAISMLDKVDFDLKAVWDQYLVVFAQRPEWLKERYHELNYNCFDFVVSFLNFIKYPQWKQIDPHGTRTHPTIPHLLTRESLIQDYILPTSSRGSKYISLIKSIHQYGYVIQRTGDLLNLT